MVNSIWTILKKCALWGIFWFIVLLGIALIITNLKEYAIADTLFIEGIILVISGILSSLGGNSNGLSIYGMGQSNAQYTANANLEVTKMEKEKTDKIKNNFKTGFSTVPLIIGGILSVIISIVI